MAPAPCEGSGLCCKKGPCGLYWRWVPEGVSNEEALAPWRDGEGCPHLTWDPEAFRYWCGLVLLGGAQRPAMERALYIGDGCCMTLFNADRRSARR